MSPILVHLPPRLAHRRGSRGPLLMAIFEMTTWGDLAWQAANTARSSHKFTDVLVWVSFPLFFKSQCLGVGQIGLIIGVYDFT